MAVLGGDAFRVELDAVHGFGFMLQAHDQPIISFCGDLEIGREGLTFNDQGMITRDRVGRRNAFENALIRVGDV